jgi:hypothetical protein
VIAFIQTIVKLLGDIAGEAVLAIRPGAPSRLRT